MSEWTETTEKIVRTIHSSCERNRLKHLKQANISKNYHSALTVTGMILGPVAGMLASNTQISCGEDYTAKTAVVTLSVLSGIVVSIIKFGKFDEMHHLNKQASSSYHVLANNAELELTKDKSTREPATNYISWLQAKYEEVFNKSPLLPLESDTTNTQAKYAGRTGKVSSDESSGVIELDVESQEYSYAAMSYEIRRMMDK